ncbi:hypothetical protein F7Q99_09585 [Streptomyces kaniharaensis]|uniref:YCII-related domain-containing protein n=1 Tax=Streptomyces kaniharaensis TaxID=212423 RepID=A0A6N7KPP4_9ACTN|nr:hypothetical protein [Streptomyces kaniharaensis]MQS12529.1 hypothetical protein [Streptomyces kaniharaensis]
MTKYLVLYWSTQSARDRMAQATPEETKAGMDAWMRWAREAGSAVVDLGSPLGPLKGRGSEEGANQISGFSVLQAESDEALDAVLADHPHLSFGGTILALEFLPVPGM